MGNKLQGRDIISYKTKSGLVVSIPVNDLQGAKKFPKTPRKEDIIQKYNQWIQNVILEDQDIKLLQTVESKYKFRICYLHDQIIEKINSQKRQEIQTNQIYIDQLSKTINRLFEDYNDVDLSSIIKSLQNLGCIDQKVELIKNMNFIPYLTDRLILLEQTSRITNNFRDQIRILELFQTILNTQNINHNSLFYDSKCFKSIIQNFHPIEPKITSLVFKVIAGQNGLSWKENNYQNIQDAFENLQNLYKFENKFQIFIRTIYYTKNLIMIYQIIKFLFRYLYSLDDKNQLQVITELNTTKVNDKQLEEIFKQIKLRIKLNLYKKEDCTYETIRNILNTFEHPLNSYNQENPRMTMASFTESTFDDKINNESDYYSSQNIQDLNFLQDQYYYYEEGQEHVFKAIKQSVIEWIDAIQNIGLLSLKENEVDSFFLENENTQNYSVIGEKDTPLFNQTLSKTTQNSHSEQDNQSTDQKNYKSKYQEAKEIINELRNQLEQQKEQNNQKLQELSLQNQKLNQDNIQTIKKLQEQINQLKQEIQNYKTQKQEDSKSQSNQLNQSNIQQKNQSPKHNIDSQQQQQSTQIPSNNTTKISSPPPPPPPPPQPQPIQTVMTNLPLSPPPPPPSIQTTGVPPPPPPPILKTNNQQPQQLIRKQQSTPSKPMKPLFWTVIPDSKAFKTIFETIQNEEITLDTQFLEMNFCKPNEIQKQRDNQIDLNIKQQKIKLLQPERSQNIEIVLSKLRLNINTFSNSLLQINLEVLNENLINSLIAICPTQEEIELLNEFTGDKQQLGQSELFIDSLRKVNGFQFRIKALHFMYNYHENKSTFLKQTEQLSEAFMNLKNSQELQTIILVVLRLGNFLNSKTSKGNIAAFKLEAIEKCSDLKTIDNQQNLLSYVIEKSEQILKKDVINNQMITQFEIIEKISLSQLQQSLNEIKKGKNLIVQSIESASDNPNDFVAIQFQPILTEIQQDFVKLQDELLKIDKYYKECCEFYCENSQDQSDKFGEKIMKILRCLYKNKQEKIIKLEKIRRAEEQKQKQQQSQSNEKQITRNDKVNKTWIAQNQQNQGQIGIKNGRESFVDKEIKELYKIKNQNKLKK